GAPIQIRYLGYFARQNDSIDETPARDQFPDQGGSRGLSVQTTGDCAGPMEVRDPRERLNQYVMPLSVGYARDREQMHNVTGAPRMCCCRRHRIRPRPRNENTVPCDPVTVADRPGGCCTGANDGARRLQGAALGFKQHPLLVRCQAGFQGKRMVNQADKPEPLAL